MAETNEQKMDVEFQGMPGADLVSEEEAKSFQVSLDFEGADLEKEEVEFPKDEEEVVEETLEAKEEPEVEAEAETEVEAEAEEVEVEEPEEVEEVEAKQEEPEVVEAEAEVEPEKPKAPMVPKSRLDEVLARNKKLQKQIDAQAEQEASREAEAPKYDFDVKEQQYQQLVLDGETTKATALRGEIRNAEREQLMFEVQKQTGQTVERNREEQELAVKAQEIEETFSVLNENSTDFDKELATEVRDLRDAFMTQGYGAADALAKATDVTLTMQKPELLQSDGQDKVTRIATKRKKTGVKKKLEASKAQPPTLKGEGTSKRGDSAPDINVLSDEEFGALPEETLRRMRGDFG